MKDLKVVSISDDVINFEGGYSLYSDHQQDCCENHYLDLSHLSISDFEGLLFDLSSDDFFKRIEDYGIELIPIKGWGVKIPGYGYNNGYYSSDLSLLIDKDHKTIKTYYITECQNIKD